MKNRIFFSLTFILVISFAYAQIVQHKVFYTSGEWTCPPGVFDVTVVCIGGGGGGGGAGTVNKGGSGGGSGAYVGKEGIPVVPGAKYQVEVGDGGTGGSGYVPSVPAGKGGSSFFMHPDTLRADGGCGGYGDNGAPGVGGCNGSGGMCNSFLFNECVPYENNETQAVQPGWDGSSGSSSFGGQGGNAPNGGLGGSKIVFDSNGSSGSVPGGGGGGAFTANSMFKFTGGSGAGGMVVIAWYEPTQGIQEEQKQTIQFRNFPNPFTTYTQIQYVIPDDAIVNLNIYNIQGVKILSPVLNQKQHKGLHKFTFYRDNLEAGIYLLNISLKTSSDIYNASNFMIIY